MAKVVVTAVKVKGSCAAGIKEGDKYVIDGPNIDLKNSDVICAYAMCSIFPTIFAVRLGYDPEKLGLREKVIQCIDPGEPYTAGGTVYFRIERTD